MQAPENATPIQPPALGQIPSAETAPRERSPRVALYARVSTANHGQDPELQLRELREYCAHRGWAVAGEYVDRGISGAKTRRPELDRLMHDATRRRIDVVAVWKFDRFARSVSHLLRALEQFESLGISFISLSESIDTTTPMGKMVFTVLGAVAELERSLIVERVRAGLRNARAKGRRLGRPTRFIDSTKIFALRRAGQGWKSIARELDCGVGTILRVADESGLRTMAAGARAWPAPVAAVAARPE